MDELKPCPFCGDMATLKQNYTLGANKPGYVVVCMRCGANTWQEITQELAENNWQSRPIEDALRARAERAEAALKDAAEVLEGNDLICSAQRTRNVLAQIAPTTEGEGDEK